MVKVWTIDEVSTKDYDANGNLVDLTDAERNAKLIEWNDYEKKSPQKKLKQIKEIRLQKLQETDYLANSDVVMPENIKTWRQNLRDIPANHVDEDAYDLLLARDEITYNLTHSIWSKP
jgi:hypothetical protein